VNGNLSAKILTNKTNKFGTPTHTPRPNMNTNSVSRNVAVSSLKRPNVAPSYQTPSYSKATKTTSNRVINSARSYRGPGFQASAKKAPTALVTELLMATPASIKNPIETKRISRTVDCARVSLRRSIQTLNNVLCTDNEQLKTPSSKNPFRRSTFRK
jgi:hypothetical protein